MQKILIDWFRNQKRDLPWRHNPHPYPVWVSEVMLQQTQVAVVIPYFQRWMQQFPTIKSLANAPLEDVIKAWEGLGYYSRARNLHAGAQYVVKHFGGELPNTVEGLSQIKGLGPYTIGAILSFAFKQKIAAVDGNVIRVLTRFFQIEEDISKPKTVSKIRLLADEILPDQEPWIFNEALIELGATVCSRRPKCFECPISNQCKAYQTGVEEILPFNTKKTTIQQLHRAVCVIRHQDLFLVKKGLPGEIMADLYEFPYLELSNDHIQVERLVHEVKSQWKLKVKKEKSLPETKHSFTRFRVRLFPFLLYLNSFNTVDSYEWVKLEELKQKAFSSGHRKIFLSLLEHL